MKRNMQILLVVLFVFTIAACIPVPVAVSPQSAVYYDQYDSGYGDEYVDVPIAYGEPYYLKFDKPFVPTTAIHFSTIMLSLEGKIFMEMSARQFNFFKYCIQQTFAEFSIAKAIQVYITG